MADWAEIVEQIIQDAIRAGEFSNLAGQGKPLKLDDDRSTPEHLRLAHKLLKDNDLAPDWIMEGRSLEEARVRLVSQLRRDIRERKQPFEALGRERIQRAYSEAARRLNKRILSYNLKVPPGVTHMAFFDLEREVRRAFEPSDER